MLACLDVAYAESSAVAAAVLFESWSSATPARELTARIAPIEPYVPGEFFRRELPCLLCVLEQAHEPLEALVIDGYVWLGEREGLGAHLYNALNAAIPVIGVAKTEFHGATPHRLKRKSGVRPLYITAAGMSAPDAARNIATMHGTSRLPTLLRRVDSLSRHP